MIALLLTLLFWALIAALAVALLLLVTPVLVQMRAATQPHILVRCDLRAFGGLTPRVTVFDSDRTRTQKATKPKRKRLKKKSRNTGRLAQAAPRLLADILHQLHFDKLQVDCEFGLKDPADTGQLAGVVLALTHGLPPSPRVSILALPNFQRPCFEGEVTVAIRLTVAAFVLPAARFAWHAFGPVR